MEKETAAISGRNKTEASMRTIQEMKEIAEKNPFARHIGVEFLDAAPGHARARIRLEPHHENIYGGAHGGCAFSLADTLAGIAASMYGTYVTTLQASMNYMRPVIQTEYLYCEAAIQRSGGKISVVRVELTNDHGELLMDGSFTFYHLS